MLRTFDRLRFVLPVAVEEALVAELWTLRTLGLEMREGAAGTVSIDAWFATGTVRAEVFAPWLARGVSIALETVEQQDDLAAYRAQTRPLDIGECFRVDPRDADVGVPVEGVPVEGVPIEGAPVDGAPARSEGSASENGRFLLRIPARVAFGTGSHETTRLVLTLLETLEVRGCRVLDVGCGSGILSLAALRLGAREATGFDLDSPSALVADQNAILNPWPVRPRFYAGRFDALSAAAPFDLILVNVLPERIRPDLPRLVRSLAPGGRVVSAGALVADRGDMLAAWARFGLSARAERVAGEWIGFVLARGDGPA